jgi:hypothetical protein
MSTEHKKPLLKATRIQESRDRTADDTLVQMFDMDSARHDGADAKAPGVGNLVISVLPGDELGEFCVTVQYDGADGRFDECIRRQGAQLEEIWGQVKRFLEDHFGKEFEVDVFTALPPGAPPTALAELPSELRVAVSRPAQAAADVHTKNEIK